MRYLISCFGLLFLFLECAGQTCPSGFTVDGVGGGCVDINECDISSPCSGFKVCVNTNGSFSCRCDSGFQDVDMGCMDINECVNSASNNCHNQATCTNAIGSFSCSCKLGFAGNGTFCANINECQTSPCDANATCADNVGSFTCTCNTGFIGNGTVCVVSNTTSCFGCNGSPSFQNAPFFIQSAIAFLTILSFSFANFEFPMYIV